ncbi:MAG: flagellar basal body-associated FliL family protein [Magnetococcales bacterium]|nr:flagellar basal body-associated FliL family protein [Magnetococcales bacterium]
MAEEGEKVAEPSGGGGLMKLILPVVALLIGAGGGYFLGQSMAHKSAEEAALAEPKPEEEAEQSDPSKLVGEMFKLDPFVVNLNEPRGNRYLKTTIQLEMEKDKPKLKEELTARQAQLQDIILALLTSKNSQELQALEGKFRLREELMSRINALVVSGTVTRVYFTEFVIQ